MTIPSINIFVSYHFSCKAFVFVLLFASCIQDIHSQDKTEKKEEIKITSSFKPSIIKQTKPPLFASPPDKDSTPFRFKYDCLVRANKTLVRPFLINPLDVEKVKTKTDSAGFFSKAGYGNLQNPHMVLAYENNKRDRNISIRARHVSAKGELPDQQYASTSISATADTRIDQHQHLNFNLGYELNNYRQYGFDHELFSFNENQVRQRFDYFHTSISLSSVLDETRNSVFSPLIYFGHFSSGRSAKESELAIAFPYERSLNDKLSISVKPKADLVFFSGVRDTSRFSRLFQLPFSATFNKRSLSASAGVNLLNYQSGTSILPSVDLRYAPLSSSLSFLLDISNKANVNTFHFLATQNPYIQTPDSLSVFRQVDYGAGIQLDHKQKFSLKAIAGVSQFNNLPLYINVGSSGKDLKVLYEPKLNLFHFKTEMRYSPSEQFDLKADLNSYTFNGKSNGIRAYGFIPLELSADLIWKPTTELKLNAVIRSWKGAWAFSESKSDHLLKNVVDMNLGIDYNLNKKWGIWLDLNNIANMKYQRWSQYASFGFNVVGGVRFKLFTPKRTN